MNNNIQNTIKKFSAILIADLLLVCSLSFPAYATSPWEGQPIPIGTSTLTAQQVCESGFLYNVSSSSGWEYEYYIVSTTDSADVYWFGYGTNSSSMKGLALSRVQFSYLCARTQYNTSNGSLSYAIVQSNSSGTTPDSNGFYRWSGTSSMANPTGPIFDTIDDGEASLSEFLDNPSTSPHPLSFSLNPGYVVFIDVSDLSNVEVNLSTTLFSGSDWNNHTTDQNIGLLSSIPSSVSLPITGTSHISWSGYGNTNILGQYKSFYAPYTYTTVGRGYVCIVNPLQSRQSAQLTAMSALPSARNNPISISISFARSAKIYSLTSTLDVGSGTLDIESNGDTDSGSPDSNGQWVWNNDQTGQPIYPNDLPIGGGNDPIIGQETSINDWLQDIANQIKGFFSGAISAVTTLVGAGSAFINSLVSLYSWLPGNVYAVLSSALILVITIGVIKVFI